METDEATPLFAAPGTPRRRLASAVAPETPATVVSANERDQQDEEGPLEESSSRMGGARVVIAPLETETASVATSSRRSSSDDGEDETSSDDEDDELDDELDDDDEELDDDEEDGHLHAIEVDSNEALADGLEARGAVRSVWIAAAFRSVDRAWFAPSRCRERAYDDSPLRAHCDEGLAPCVVHLSAPSIYAAALEALDLRPRLSFLNLGSGSGYLSALAQTALSRCAVHHCVERCPALAQRCRDAFAAMPRMRHAVVTTASVFDLDPKTSQKFDRIYCGAGAVWRTGDAAFLVKFLKPGGCLVGPFELPADDGTFDVLDDGRRRFLVLDDDHLDDDSDDDDDAFDDRARSLRRPPAEGPPAAEDDEYDDDDDDRVTSSSDENDESDQDDDEDEASRAASLDDESDSDRDATHRYHRGNDEASDDTGPAGHESAPGRNRVLSTARREEQRGPTIAARGRRAATRNRATTHRTFVGHRPQCLVKIEVFSSSNCAEKKTPPRERRRDAGTTTPGDDFLLLQGDSESTSARLTTTTTTTTTTTRPRVRDNQNNNGPSKKTKKKKTDAEQQRPRRRRLRVEHIMPVQFTPLSRPPPDALLGGQPHTRRRGVALRGPRWGADAPELFPSCFKLAVALLARGAANGALVAPWHVWEVGVLPYLAYDDVRQSRDHVRSRKKGFLSGDKAIPKKKGEKDVGSSSSAFFRAKRRRVRDASNSHLDDATTPRDDVSPERYPLRDDEVISASSTTTGVLLDDAANDTDAALAPPAAPPPPSLGRRLPPRSPGGPPDDRAAPPDASANPTTTTTTTLLPRALVLPPALVSGGARGLAAQP